MAQTRSPSSATARLRGLDETMSSFAELLRSACDAATTTRRTDIFRTYEPHVKRLVRHLIRIEAIRPIADPSDVCQSVMASFFIRAALGEDHITKPEQLMSLLKRMARNKVVDLRRVLIGGSLSFLSQVLSLRESSRPTRARPREPGDVARPASRDPRAIHR